MDLESLSFEPDGSVRNGRFGDVIAHFDDDGTVRAGGRFGDVLAFIENDGTIRSGGRFGDTLGVVESNGVVKRESRFGDVVATVGPPIHKNAAIVLLFG